MRCLKLMLFMMLFILATSSVLAIGARITPACVGFDDATNRCAYIDVCKGENIIEYHIYNTGGKYQTYYMIDKGIQVIFTPQTFEVAPGEFQKVSASIDTKYLDGHVVGYVYASSDPIDAGGNFNMAFVAQSKLQLNAISNAQCLYRVPKIYVYTAEDGGGGFNWMILVYIGGALVVVWLIWFLLFRKKGKGKEKTGKIIYSE